MPSHTINRRILDPIEEMVYEALQRIAAGLLEGRSEVSLGHCLGGGGDVVEAGSGITITRSSGRKIISVSGGGTGVTVETPVGTVNSINTVFTVTAEPKWVVSGAATYFDGAGYTYSALSITMDIPPNQGEAFRAII